MKVFLFRDNHSNVKNQVYFRIIVNAYLIVIKDFFALIKLDFSKDDKYI